MACFFIPFIGMLKKGLRNLCQKIELGLFELKSRKAEQQQEQNSIKVWTCLLPIVSCGRAIKKAIALLEEWFSTSDDLGSALWEKFDKALEANKVTL